MAYWKLEFKWYLSFYGLWLSFSKYTGQPVGNRRHDCFSIRCLCHFNRKRLYIFKKICRGVIAIGSQKCLHNQHGRSLATIHKYWCFDNLVHHVGRFQPNCRVHFLSEYNLLWLRNHNIKRSWWLHTCITTTEGCNCVSFRCNTSAAVKYFTWFMD